MHVHMQHRDEMEPMEPLSTAPVLLIMKHYKGISQNQCIFWVENRSRMSHDADDGVLQHDCALLFYLYDWIAPA